MKALTAKHAQYGSGRPIDLARAEPVAVPMHGRPVVVVMAVANFEQLADLVRGDEPALSTDADLRDEDRSR